jgi:hypothetical protein
MPAAKGSARTPLGPIINGYGPKGNDTLERKRKSWDFLEREVCNAIVAGAGLVLQMDGNCHLGPELLKGDINAQHANGKLFAEFMDRNPHLVLVNSRPICEGLITRMRKTTKGMEMSALDVFLVCDKIIPYATRMVIDEKREHVLTNYSAVKHVGKIVESDHNPLFLYLNLQFSRIRKERVEIF